MSGEEASSQSSQFQASSDEGNSSDSGSDPDFYFADSLPNMAYDDDPILEDGEEVHPNMEACDEDSLEPAVLEARLENRISLSKW